MLSVFKNLPKILICILLFIFSIAIMYHYFRKDILEGFENPDEDEDDNDSGSCQTTSARNSGQIEFIKNSLEQLKVTVEKNTQELAKLNDAKQQVEKNTNHINQNSKAIMKAMAGSKLSKKQDALLKKK